MAGPARNQDEVCGLNGRDGGLLRSRWCVDEYQVGAGLPGPLGERETVARAGRRRRPGDSASRRSDHLLVVACGSRSTMTTERPGLHGGHCQGDCQSRFSGPTFLGDDGDYTHVRPREYTMLREDSYSLILVYEFKCMSFASESCRLCSAIPVRASSSLLVK